jgi:hypothetical protein
MNQHVAVRALTAEAKAEAARILRPARSATSPGAGRIAGIEARRLVRHDEGVAELDDMIERRRRA